MSIVNQIRMGWIRAIDNMNNMMNEAFQANQDLSDSTNLNNHESICEMQDQSEMHSPFEIRVDCFNEDWTNFPRNGCRPCDR
jgi:hypothetical protein